MNKALLPSFVRIATAAVVGFVLNLPLAPVVLDFFNVTSDQATVWLGGAVALVVTTVYYNLVRVLETKYRDGAGWLLGYANQPKYNAPAVTSGTRYGGDSTL
jgi:hypothetical protein